MNNFTYGNAKYAVLRDHLRRVRRRTEGFDGTARSTPT